MEQKIYRLEQLERQINQIENKIKKLEAESNKYSLWRLLIFTAGIIVTTITFSYSWRYGFISLALFIAAFTFVAVLHVKLKNNLLKHYTGLKLKTTNAARINLDWQKIPEPFLTPDLNHPFENDLDITGKYSIHRLIDSTVTREGSQLLRDWLTARNPDFDKIMKRQGIISELKNLRVFREKVIMNARIASKETKGKWEGKKLLKWLNINIPEAEIKKILVISSVISLANLIMIILNLTGITGNYWKFTIIFNLFYFFTNDKYTKTLLAESMEIELELNKIRNIFGYLENFNYGKNAKLAEFIAPFKSKKYSPTVFLTRLKKIIGGVGLRMNPALWLLLNALLPWDFYFAYRLSSYKNEIKDIFPVWLNKWFELEAMIALANFSFINQDYTFPVIYHENNRPEDYIFKGSSMGHPLLSKTGKTCNDFTMEYVGEAIIITGSNMAGKSTFLRTLGTNICLAYAGSAVNAVALETTMFRLFSCIRVSDSVTDGLSYFYAEVKRLKALLDELKSSSPKPMFFLIDEIFKGTNNRERLIGSRSFIRALINLNGSGFISTHDLDLTKLAEDDSKILNYHFREEVTEGQMVFDYKIRKGPCPTTNALKIMEIEGLPVMKD